jgi:hypothetical protein
MRLVFSWQMGWSSTTLKDPRPVIPARQPTGMTDCHEILCRGQELVAATTVSVVRGFSRRGWIELCYRPVAPKEARTGDTTWG